MKTDMQIRIGFSYLRLSDEDIKTGESESITNQRRIINDFCKRNNITLVGEFVDDGWSGGNFKRPGFLAMIEELKKGKVNTVITKDLQRLGRNATESSYYAEQYFPENNIHYLTVSGDFDSQKDNEMAPFHFAINEYYLRNGSKKIKQVLQNKRENGLYCACPPYGYKKDEDNKNLLVPDENTAPIVQRIFQRAALGDSSRKIALDLNKEGIIPPLKYRVLYRDNFGEKGASRASDFWNNTTVKRVLQNKVYLGHTVLGKTKKVSFKSDKKISVNKEDWVVTENTHEPLVTQQTFDNAQKWLGKHTKLNTKYDNVRKSIFSGIIYCSKCGHALCSCGSVYKGEREKYWYLGCTQKREGALHPCEGVRIRYKDILEVIRQDINTFISINDDGIKEIVDNTIETMFDQEVMSAKERQLKKAQARLKTIESTITKLYIDNAQGKLTDERLHSMVQSLEKETEGLNTIVKECQADVRIEDVKQNFNKFFNIAKQHTYIKELDRHTLAAFVDRIEVGEKKYSDGVLRDTHNNKPFTQEIKIYYKFIGNILSNETKEFQQKCV